MASNPSLVESLRAQRGSLIEELVAEVTPILPFYASLPPEVQQAMAGRIVDLTLDALVEWRPEAVLAYGADTISRRRQQGARFGDIFGVLQKFRGIVSRRVWRSGAPLEEAGAVLDRVNDVVDGVLGVAREVFEHQLEETSAAAKVLEARYREAYIHAPAMMHSIDRQGRIDTVSERWLAVLGYARDEVLGLRPLDLVTEESRRRAVEIDGPRLRAEGEIWDAPYQVRKKSGEVVDVLLSMVTVHDAQGEAAGYLAVLEDVTEKLRMERALRESEQRWRTLVSTAPLPLLVQKGGVITWANDAMLQLLRASRPEDVVGRTTLDITHPDDHAVVVERRARIQASDDELPRVELRAVRCDGTVAHVEVTSRPLVQGGERCVQIALVDVTARKEAEEERRRSEVQAELIRAQDEALRVLSTPLIPLGDGVLVMPLVGRITDERATGIVEALAGGVVEQGARVAIVDVTGVPVAEAGVAAALLRAAQVVRLLGAEVVLTGIQPSMAQTLVELGADLGGIVTRGTLRDGIRHAMDPGPARARALDAARQRRRE